MAACAGDVGRRSKITTLLLLKSQGIWRWFLIIETALVKLNHNLGMRDQMLQCWLSM